MKRLVILLAFTACQLFAMAQKELHIGPLFEGKIVPHDQMVETRVRGRSLSKYGLTYFHSLRFEPSGKEEKTLKKLLKEDMAERASQEYKCYIDDEKDLYQVFMQLPAVNGKNRMLCYKQHYDRVLVIYMEGPGASFNTLEKMSNK
ncbi:hypothetical protein SAMN02910409_1301 [Prevotellaceae bacterium HUN156]|nr:hypothetical protein SAMN02910409_1301 [Prevotellaceae bacterium HUN156]